jgi:hypothetical protein
MTPSGIDPTTFCFVAHASTPAPLHVPFKKLKEHIIIDRSLILTTMWNIIKSAADMNVKNEYIVKY